MLPTIGQFGGDEFERAKAIYGYLKSKGVTDQAIAAILGNWSVESSINPKRAEGDYLSPPIGATDSSWDDEGWLSLNGPTIYYGRYPNILKRGLGLYSSKIKIIRCQLALMNSSSIVGFVS